MTAFCSYPTFSLNPANPGWPNLLATLFSPLGRWVDELHRKTTHAETTKCIMSHAPRRVHIVVDASWKKYMIVISVAGLARKETTGGGQSRESGTVCRITETDSEAWSIAETTI